MQGRPLTSIFFGGGTPSLFSARAIGAIIETAERRIGFAPGIEITLEANPGTLEQDRFTGYRVAGVNRLSIGVQSFQPRQLQTLGRIHSADEAIAAASTAVAAGLTAFNLDLMHGLPEQTPAQAREDLARAIDLGASHLSWYQLTIEPNTAFYNQPPVLPGDDRLAEIQQKGEDQLRDGGYRQYEISAFARPGHESTHNLNYWEFGDYIGIGAGAHGKLTDPDTDTIVRRWKTRLPAHYMDRHDDFSAGERQLMPEERPLEFLMNALRLNRGFTPSLFESRTGLTFDTVAARLQKQCDRGLLAYGDGHYRTTALGRQFLNDVLAEC